MYLQHYLTVYPQHTQNPFLLSAKYSWVLMRDLGMNIYISKSKVSQNKQTNKQTNKQKGFWNSVFF